MELVSSAKAGNLSNFLLMKLQNKTKQQKSGAYLVHERALKQMEISRDPSR